MLTRLQQLEEDLLAEEFSDIWDKAPKFPDVEASEERVDVDSFVQVYRDIDDLFESEVSDDAAAASEETPKAAPPASEVKSENNSAEEDDEDDEEGETLEAELESIYESICDKNGLISKDALQAWDEVGKLLEDGLLGEDEFEDLWEKTQKSSGSSEVLDVDGFLSFNVALDGLFDFDAEEMTEDDDEEPLEASSPAVAESREMVEGESLSSRSLFAALADSDGLVSEGGLTRWSELQDMQAEGDLLPLELQNMFDGVAKSAKDASKLDESGFVTLYQAIADLFEDNEEVTEPEEDKEPELSGNELKQELIDTIKVVASDKDRMACGLECSETEQRQILSIVTELESRPTNIIRQKQGAVYDADLTGTWDLLYSSSSAMKYNKGLSGLGGSFPNGKFGGLTQKLMTSKFTTDVEYVERIDVTPSAASFDVTVNGGWDLRTSISIFTGEPSLVMTVEPDRVTYGPTSTRADHWKSLGPLNMLDVSYLDDDLRIMRGNTSIETVFIFRRSS
jgi:hypothetical protein